MKKCPRIRGLHHAAIVRLSKFKDNHSQSVPPLEIRPHTEMFTKSYQKKKGSNNIALVSENETCLWINCILFFFSFFLPAFCTYSEKGQLWLEGFKQATVNCKKSPRTFTPLLQCMRHSSAKISRWTGSKKKKTNKRRRRKGRMSEAWRNSTWGLCKPDSVQEADVDRKFGCDSWREKKKKLHWTFWTRNRSAYITWEAFGLKIAAR